MKNILLFGAGKSASVLIEYLLHNAAENNWHVTVADADQQLIEQKTKNHPVSTAVAVDISDEQKRKTLIIDSDLVISMMPAFLHILIAKDCVEYSKHLLTASYADDEIKKLADEVNKRGIIFLCEMGLDPGIDHMSAMQLLHDIKEKGGTVTSFKSHCGGLVAPESDNNPWHYKISWNPRNVVLAGKAGAEYKQNGQIITEAYENLFDAERKIETGDESIGSLSYYPNRNSISYIDLYELHSAETFVRTTLRYRDFMLGWKNIIDLKMTDETPAYNSDGLTLASFFRHHMDKYKFDISTITDKTVLEQLYFIGWHDEETTFNKGLISAADGLQFALETKLALSTADKDMIVMQHEIDYEINDTPHHVVSSLVVKGKDNINTAMAKTVGLPLGIAAKLILNGTIQLSGLHLPIIREIYEPVMKELRVNGIRFSETNNMNR